MNRYNVIGVMSGTSLDGLDLAHCSFELDTNNNWHFQINSTTTIPLPDDLYKNLTDPLQISGFDLMKVHNELGNFIGLSINKFIQDHSLVNNQIDCISSHGHTIYHQPERKLTTQIGNGATISAITALPVICDFRTTDVALGGHGAPLVPIGDELLFSNYDYCINLGGIANISYKENNQRIAYDICPTNIVLNYLSQNLGVSYDNNGNFAKAGKIDLSLLERLNSLTYYQENPPKSLGIEWINEEVFPIINNSPISNEDKLRTFVEHIADQISSCILETNKNILFSGGGTFNSFLMDRIQSKTNNIIIIPPTEIINYKEALIFAFLGVLRLRKEKNCLQSVTGADQDNIGGCIYQAF